jgi:hypothetical protein
MVNRDIQLVQPEAKVSTTVVRFLARTRGFSLLHSVQTGCGADSNTERGKRWYSGRSVKLTAQLHPVPRLRMVELYLRFPIRPHGVVLN